MDIATLTTFFKYCTIFNGSLFTIWALFVGFAPDLVYKTQHYFFPIPREKYNIIMYVFLGAFKTMFLFFNVTPFLVLLYFC